MRVFEGAISAWEDQLPDRDCSAGCEWEGIVVLRIMSSYRRREELIRIGIPAACVGGEEVVDLLHP